MKTSATNPLIIGCFGLAIGILLPGCVDPYYAGPPQRVTTYHPGYEVRSLPPGYRTVVIGGTRYYSHGGHYYRPRSGGYVVVEVPRHDGGNYDGRPRDDYGYQDRPSGHRDVIITRLPPGYREINHRRGRYYQVNDTYYQQRGSGYVIVTSPY